MADDLRLAAEEEGRYDLARIGEQTRANRIESTDPYGSMTYGRREIIDPNTGQQAIDPISGQPLWQATSSYQLNQPLQDSLTSMQNVGALKGQLAEGTMQRYWDSIKDPMNFEQYGDPIQMQQARQVGNFDFDYSPEAQMRAEDAAYQRATARLDPQFNARRASLETRLRNQGLSPGDQAYDAAMSNLGRESADAYEMARLGAISEGRADMAQNYGMALGTSQQQAALGGQEFGQNMQQSQLANALRTQQIGEDIGQRNFYLNEANNQLSGVNVPGSPQSAPQSQSLTLEQG